MLDNNKKLGENEPLPTVFEFHSELFSFPHRIRLRIRPGP